jgi:hypothetical protein
MTTFCLRFDSPTTWRSGPCRVFGVYEAITALRGVPGLWHCAAGSVVPTLRKTVVPSSSRIKQSKNYLLSDPLKMAVIRALETYRNTQWHSVTAQVTWILMWVSECNIHLTTHLPSWGIRNLIQERCTGVSRRCTQMFKERKKGIL